MNNVFSFSRFGKYFLYDLKNARNNYGLSLIIIGLLPAIFCLIYAVFAGLAGGNYSGIGAFSASSLFVALITLVLTFPAKVYGPVTDKRIGTEFLMLPASTLEKTISVVLMTCVVLPVAFCLIFFSCDALLSLLVPMYGNSILTNLPGFWATITESAGDLLAFNGLLVSYLNWCENILIFTLGAVCFKKFKAGNTILAYFLFSMAIVLIFVAIFKTISLGPEHIERIILKLDSFENPAGVFKAIIYSFYVIFLGAAIGGLYYRLKTLKH